MQFREIVPRTGNFGVFARKTGAEQQLLFAEQEYGSWSRVAPGSDDPVFFWDVRNGSCRRIRAAAEELGELPFLGEITGYGVNAFHARGAKPKDIRDFIRIYGVLAPRAGIFGFFWRLIFRK